ncbi:MAG: hypothetical protein JW395_3667 [Nitrospira sp.]|nr:hypothetical protein [Nitrospira sp.]
MKYSGASFSVFLVDGYSLAASVTESASMGRELLTQQTNPFGVETESHTPVGLVKGTLVCGGGLFDAATDALHSDIGDVVGVSRTVCAAIYGNTPGKPFMGFEGAYSQKYEIQDQKDGLTKANISYLISGAVDEGQIVQDLATFTADWDTKTGGANSADTPVDYTTYDGNRPVPITSNTIANPSVVTTTKVHGLTTGDKVLIAGVATSSPTINGTQAVTVISTTTFSVPVNVTVAGTGGTIVKVDTNAGGVAYCQCTAFSGLTNLVLKITHSPDDSTYAALTTFATITAVTKERKTVTGTVDRYLSSNGDVTGTGSVTVFSGFCRN